MAKPKTEYHPALVGLGRVLKSYLTAPDGESYAPGRIMGFAVFVIGQIVAIYVVRHIGHDGKTSVADWALGLQSVAIWEGAICTLATGLVLGMAPTDSGGKWWDKTSKGPPPPTDTPPTTIPE
jgi:hypothetical protein